MEDQVKQTRDKQKELDYSKSKKSTFEKNDNMEKVYVSLSFTGKNINPEKISELLRMNPCIKFKRGEVRKDGLRIWSHGAWMISSSEEINSIDLLRHINWLINKLNPVKNELAKIVSQKRIKSKISFFWIMPQNPKEFQISPELLYMLSEFGINIEFCFYSS